MLHSYALSFILEYLLGTHFLSSSHAWSLAGFLSQLLMIFSKLSHFLNTTSMWWCCSFLSELIPAWISCLMIKTRNWMLRWDPWSIILSLLYMLMALSCHQRCSSMSLMEALKYPMVSFSISSNHTVLTLNRVTFFKPSITSVHTYYIRINASWHLTSFPQTLASSDEWFGYKPGCDGILNNVLDSLVKLMSLSTMKAWPCWSWPRDVGILAMICTSFLNGPKFFL